MCVCVCVLSHVQLFATPWTAAHQAPLSMEFSRQEWWNGLPFPTPGGLPDPGIEPDSPASLVLSGRFFTTEPPGEPVYINLNQKQKQPWNTAALLFLVSLAVRYEYSQWNVSWSSVAIAGPRTLRHSSPCLFCVLESEDGNTALTMQVMRRPKGARGASRWRDPGALNTTWSKCTCELETAILYCNENNKILALEATEIGGLFMATTTIPNGYIYKSLTVYIPIVLGFPGGSDGKEFACNTGDMGPRSGWFPWRREWLPTPVFLPGEFHGQRSLAGYRPWGHKESDWAAKAHTCTSGIIMQRIFN